ncbi:ras family protein [Phaffia rhodozyma]|uniref:Ras family protein n=1 Tax=Phaffia rhodozyma TaxID=264483 RepID=A0A0F7SKQ3_PHARH|nr:ras family protein [Phaffia rhodozyma]
MPEALKRKVAVMGSRSVGKSSLVARYVDGPAQEIDSYHPTIEQVKHKKVSFAGRDFDIEVVDTAGQDSSSFFPLKYAVGVHGYVMVYSITNRASFDLVQTIYDKMLEQTGAEWAPCVIVGNKSDLNGNRAVPTAEAKAFAQRIKAPFVETSAVKNDKIDEPVQSLLAEIWKSEGNVLPSAAAPAKATGGSWFGTPDNHISPIIAQATPLEPWLLEALSIIFVQQLSPLVLCNL